MTVQSAHETNKKRRALKRLDSRAQWSKQVNLMSPDEVDKKYNEMVVSTQNRK